MDAGIALRWLLDEAETSSAFELLGKSVLHAPDCLLVEVSNDLWVDTCSYALDRDGAQALYERPTAFPITFWPTAGVIAQARSASFAYDLTVYHTLVCRPVGAKWIPIDHCRPTHHCGTPALGET